jgi:squalene-hopene/tetraprenyl-beta-curcumene cyclase
MKLLAFFAAALCAFADWNPKAAAQYLETRQKEWLSFAPAKAAGGPCVSCHTGLTYLIARPGIERVLGAQSKYDEGLLNGLRTRLDGETPKPTPGKGTESVIAALLLRDERALERMWALQIREGDLKGAWPWFNLKLDPWETADSAFFGASLAAIAVASADADYRTRPGAADRAADLQAYLLREAPAQPLHNRLALLWASTTWSNLLSKQARRAILDDVLAKQQPSGAWTIDALGPWKKPLHNPASEENYATAWATFVLLKSGIKPSEPAVARALKWLAAHQDPSTGAWPATSMNKDYEPGSVPLHFMQDAATAFAFTALLDAAR